MTTATTSAPELLTLKGGFCISLAALRLAWGLEDRGCHVRIADDGVGLVVGPRRLVTPEDHTAIDEHRDELLALVRYCEAVQ